MMNLHYEYWLRLLLMAALAYVPATRADEPVKEPPTDPQTLLRLIDEALPPLITDDNTKLVAQMYAARLGKPVRETFDPTLAVSRLLGRGARLDPNCRKLVTQSGDPDPTPCRAFLGTPEGTGPYKELSYAKHLQTGDLGFVDRTAQDPDLTFDKLPPVKMSDEEAYANAKDWLAGNFGLPMEEVPTAPAGVPNPFPVKTIELAGMDLGGKLVQVPVDKLVMIQRGLFVGLGKLGQGDLDWLPAPGKAFMVLDDSGVKQAGVRAWQELVAPPNPDEAARLAKTRSELVAEIAEQLAGMARGPIDHILIGLVIGASPHEDGTALLLPAVQVSVSPVARDLDEEQQEKLATMQASTAGRVMEIALVHSVDDTSAEGD